MTISTRECEVEVTRPAAPAVDDGQVADMGRTGHRDVGLLREWHERAAFSDTAPLSRRTLIGLATFFVVVTFSQSPGLIEFDTKLALVVSPISYFESFLHPWIAGQFGGAVQQGTSFLWPMGSFFAATHILHFPVWVAERIWLASILTIGSWGTIRLAEALAIGNRWTRVLAGVVYCTAPIFVTYASTSGDLLAAAFLPWMLRPLVVGSREGSTRRWAARSGVAVALMGGVNAAVTLSVLPLGLIWLVTRQAGPRRRSLAMWWVVALAMACFWWAVPVYYIAHFGYNYLPYTETSSVTTSTTSLFESIRGASFWTDYFNIGGPLLRGAWILVSEPLIIVATAVVAATGLAGLCRRTPERAFLVACLAFGVVVMAAGFSGPMGGLFSHPIQNLLQGSLAPFRNVSKFSPDVALPLALGLAGAMMGIPHLAGRSRDRIWDRRNLPLVSTFVVVLSVIVAAAPFWSGELYRSGGFASIPGYWQQAGAFLDEHQGHANALLVPGSSFGYYTWGNPVDEPLKVVASESLLWRDVVPLGSNGNDQMVDAVEQALDTGVSPPGLAQYLAREGIDYVVERNDLNLKLTGAPPPAQVHQVLEETHGLTQVASFGPYLPLSQVEHGPLPVYDSSSSLHLRPVEIFRVDANVPAVASYPTTDPVVVSGRVGSLIPLTAAGVVQDRATVLSGDPVSPAVPDASGATWAITDGNQRRTTFYGGSHYEQSYVLGPLQEPPNGPAGLRDSYDVVSGAEHQAVEAPVGAKSVAASSFSATPLQEESDQGPASAFDGDPSTAWTAALTGDSIGQWVSISFVRPIHMSSINLTPVPGSPEQPTITEVKLTTEAGSVIRKLPAGQKSYRLTVAPGESRYLRVTLEGVTPARVSSRGGIVNSAAIADIRIPGVSFEPRLRLPDDEAKSFSDRTSPGSVVAFSRSLDNDNLDLGLAATDDPDMRREFSIPKAESVTATGYAVPQPGPSLAQLIEWFSPVPKGSLVVTASSTLGELPRFSPQNLVEGSPLPWIANFGDRLPWIQLSWPGMHSISEVAINPTSDANIPTLVSITPAGGKTVVRTLTSKGGIVKFPETVTNSLKITFLSDQGHLFQSPMFGLGVSLPVGLESVSVPELLTVPDSSPSLSTRFDLACGKGPTVEIDGQRYGTSVSGTMGDLINLKPVAFSLCTPTGELSLGQGTHNFSATDAGAQFLLAAFVMQPADTSSVVHPALAADATLPHRKVSVLRWSGESRSIDISSGPATYIVVAQNYNPGWVARLGKVTLAPVRFDGWQQGYLVPGGKAGTITMVMQSNGPFQLLLLLGATLLIGLLLLALLPSRRRSPDGLSAATASFWFLLCLSALVLLVVAGPLVLVMLPLLAIARRWGRRPLIAITFMAFVVAGLFAAIHPASLVGSHPGALQAPAQVASAVAFAALLSVLVADSRIAFRSERDEMRGSTA
jgi:arabinofuranan 3-O-arabinosyltransferase